MRSAPKRRLLGPALAALLIIALLLPTAALAKKGHGHGHGKGHVANVMTRNLYLGADLTPAILAPTLPQFVQANGQILREVTANNFPVRAEGLAN